MIEGWQGRSNNRVPFGLKDGRLHFVSQVETGLACGCVCPDPRCGQPLIARNKPSPDRTRAYHFMHAAEAHGCTGRESALHRMAKETLMRAAALTLPAWRSEAFNVPGGVMGLAPGGAAEVTLLDGQIRPDVRVSGFVDGIALAPLYVEVRVHHAVDEAKTERVRSGRLNMLEIDLSELTDEQAVDPAAFEQALLGEPANRRWVHLDAPAYMAARTGQVIYDVRTAEAFRHDVPYKNGHLIVQRQRAVLYRGSEPGEPIDFELPNRSVDGVAIDGYGNLIPYRPGLYVRNPAHEERWDRGHHYKTFLTPLRPVDAAAQPRLL